MDKAGSAITTRAREQFDDRQVALIQRTVAKDCDSAELHMFLEIAARYELDPFAGQIYAVKMPGKNGSRGRVAIITGRDGFLTIANRHADFEGIEGDVVRDNDDFRRLADGTIEHAYSKPKERGAIVGAWAKVYRAGRKTTYFYAPWDEYKSNKQTWRDYPSAMILKVAESVALRKAFSISGLVGEEEIAAAAQSRPAEPSGQIDYGEDPALAERLEALFGALNAHDSALYRPAKIKALLAPLDHSAREELARKLEDEIVELGAEMPEPPVVDGEAVEIS